MDIPVKIGNAQGFWGDRVGAASRLLSQQPEIDFITMDYLAEVTMSILAAQREKNPALGYAVDFFDELRLLIPFWKKGSKVKVVVNAGGLNPLGCAKVAAEILRESNCPQMKIGVVVGDDVTALLQAGGNFPNLDTGEPIATVRDRLVCANAYLGAEPIVEALKNGADIVITGRVADPSLALACVAYYHDWSFENYDYLAGGTLAGHLIECGTQVTGGISTNWLDVFDPANIGFPIVEVASDGSFVVTKPLNTGGVVNEETVKEQMLYELGDPDNYLSPDVTASFMGVTLHQDGPDRIKVVGAKGRPPPTSYKVSVAFRDGYMAEGMLIFFGWNVQEKARRCGEVVLERVYNAGYSLERTLIECIGCGDVVPGIASEIPEWELRECVLRVSVAGPCRKAVECFAKELAPLVTSGAQGVTGYASGRPKVRKVFGYWPCLLENKHVATRVEMVKS